MHFHAPKNIYGPELLRMFVDELGGPKAVHKYLGVTERTVFPLALVWTRAPRCRAGALLGVAIWSISNLHRPGKRNPPALSSGVHAAGAVPARERHHHWVAFAARWIGQRTLVRGAATVHTVSSANVWRTGGPAKSPGSTAHGCAVKRLCRGIRPLPDHRSAGNAHGLQDASPSGGMAAHQRLALRNQRQPQAHRGAQICERMLGCGAPEERSYKPNFSAMLGA